MNSLYMTIEVPLVRELSTTLFALMVPNFFMDRFNMTTWKIEVWDEGDDEEVVSFDLDPNY